jgi:hypothetical protein
VWKPVGNFKKIKYKNDTGNDSTASGGNWHFRTHLLFMS